MNDPASKYFSSKTTERDRAVFEAGIAIGTLVHQFTGIPVRSLEDLEIIKKAIERSLLAQPFREEVKVELNIELPQSNSPYAYTTIKTRNIDARIIIKYGRCRVTARLRYIPELDYNLGYIEDIQED